MLCTTPIENTLAYRRTNFCYSARGSGDAAMPSGGVFNIPQAQSKTRNVLISITEIESNA